MTEQDELSRMLHEKVQAFDVRPSDVPQVEARAGRIRARRRVAAVAAVAAAVVAAAVPAALALRPGDPSGAPVHPRPTAPTTSASTTTPSALSRMRQGGDPKVDWRQGRTVHLAGGRTLTLPDGIWDTFAPYRGGVVAGTTNDIADEVVVVGADGSVVSRGQGSAPVLSPDGSTVTWWSHSDGGSAFISGPSSDAGGADTRLPTTARRPRAVGYLGDRLVYRVDSDTGGVAVSCGDSCTVTISGMTMVRAVDSDRRLLAGYADATCPTKVFQVPDLAGSAARTVRVTSSWPCVRETPATFSPDGSKLALEHQGADGRFDGVRVRDSASGELLMSYRTPVGVEVGSAVWDDDSHVLLDVYSPSYHQWTLLRVGLDRSVERAAPVIPGDDTQKPFSFGAQP